MHACQKLTNNYINPNFPVFYSSLATNLASQWLHTFNQNRINEFRFRFNLADDDIANFQLRESMRLQFRGESFNFTNTPYFGAPNGSFQSINSLVPDGPRNGEIRSLRTPMRIVQFGLKVSF